MLLKHISKIPQCYVCMHAKLLKSCVTLFSMDCSLPGSSVHRSFQVRSRLSCPPTGDLPDPGIKSASLMSPALVGRFFYFLFFTTSTTWEAPIVQYLAYNRHSTNYWMNNIIIEWMVLLIQNHRSISKRKFL